MSSGFFTTMSAVVPRDASSSSFSFVIARARPRDASSSSFERARSRRVETARPRPERARRSRDAPPRGTLLLARRTVESGPVVAPVERAVVASRRRSTRDAAASRAVVRLTAFIVVRVYFRIDYIVFCTCRTSDDGYNRGSDTRHRLARRRRPVTRRRPSDRARGRAKMNPEYDYLFKLLVRFASARPRPRPRTTREMTTGVPLREISRRSVDARAEAWRRCAREDARAKT
jgi:hypothetical protein